MTEPDAVPALPESPDVPVLDHAEAASDVDRRRSTSQLAVGVVLFLVASLAALLVAGNLGVGGVLLAALIEAAAISWIYRWCEA